MPLSKKEAKETDHVQNEVMSRMEKEAGRMLDHLPYELVVEILLRLPVKSLVRFRCVCKDWYSLISSDTFITTHANRAVSRSYDKNTSNLVLFWHVRNLYNQNEVERCPHFINSNIPRFGPFCNPYRPIVGSCNGLPCTISNGCDYELWNPSIRRALGLPEPNLTSSTYSRDVYGLGYNPSSGDNKLVRLVYLLQKKSPYIQLPPQVEIYTLKSGCWRCITAPVPPYVCSSVSPLSVFVNGVSHWIAHALSGQGKFGKVIMAFDMVEEVFREIPLPICCFGMGICDAMTLAVRDGLLCLAPFYLPREQQSFSIWIMKEYGVKESWTKLFNIHMREGFRRKVGLRKMHEVLVCKRGGALFI